MDFSITPRLQSIAKAFNRDISFASPIVTPSPDRRGVLATFNAITPSKPGRRGAPQQVAALLRSLADTDPTIWAIRKTLRGFVDQARWAIVPDMDEIKEELTRWREFELSNVNPYDIVGEFETSILSDEWQEKIRQDLAESEPRPMYGQVGRQGPMGKQAPMQVPGQVPMEGQPPEQMGQMPSQMPGGDDIARDRKRLRIITIFDTYERLITQEISSHCADAQELLEHPNNDSELSWRALLTRVVDDILIYDAGVIIKNRSRNGGRLAELYDLPGQEIRRWIKPDRSTPQPPYAAYEWWHNGRAVQDARWMNNELVYIMANPQHDGYGFSPIEAAQYIIASSLDTDKFNIDFIREYNVPPTIFTMRNIDPAALNSFKLQLAEKTAGTGKFKTLVAGVDPDDFRIDQLKSAVPAQMQLDKWTNYCIAVKAMCYGMSPQDVGMIVDVRKTTQEKQAELSQVRGVRSVLHLLAAYINAEIVKPEFGEDIMFKWLDIEGPVDEQEQANIAWGDMKRGVLNINARRAEQGKPPIEGGDVNMIESGMGLIPVEQLAQWKRQQRQLAGPESGEVPLEYADMMVGPGSEELGIIYPEIGNPFAAQEEQQMAAAVAAGDISKAKDYWEKRRREIEKAIADGDIEAAQKKVEILQYNLQKVAVATGVQAVAGAEAEAGEVPPAANGAAFLRGVGAYIVDMQRRMAEIVDEEVAE